MAAPPVPCAIAGYPEIAPDFGASNHNGLRYRYKAFFRLIKQLVKNCKPGD
jgi:hypothetical protein